MWAVKFCIFYVALVGTGNLALGFVRPVLTVPEFGLWNVVKGCIDLGVVVLAVRELREAV